MNNVEDDTKIK